MEKVLEKINDTFMEKKNNIDNKLKKFLTDNYLPVDKRINIKTMDINDAEGYKQKIKFDYDEDFIVWKKEIYINYATDGDFQLISITNKSKVIISDWWWSDFDVEGINYYIYKDIDFVLSSEVIYCISQLCGYDEEKRIDAGQDYEFGDKDGKQIIKLLEDLKEKQKIKNNMLEIKLNDYTNEVEVLMGKLISFAMQNY